MENSIAHNRAYCDEIKQIAEKLERGISIFFFYFDLHEMELVIFMNILPPKYRCYARSNKID